MVARNLVVGAALSVPAVHAGCTDRGHNNNALCRFGPENSTAQANWLKDLKEDRTVTRKNIGFSGGVFGKGLRWTTKSYVQPQMHPYDRYFYDPETHQYTVEKFLDDLKKRYGGIDSVLIWPTYPHTGIDDRNQFDFFRDLPGGLDGFAKVVEELEKAGVQVLQPYKPWDIGTRREPVSDEEALATLLKHTGARGVNGDTMSNFPESFFNVTKELYRTVGLEPELGGNDTELNWSTMGWGYWSYPKVPVVDRFKFITEGKFLTHVCDRWAKDRTDNLQAAWFNGDGYESWENVWGTWNGITERDGEAIRRVATMLRFFGQQNDFLQSHGWEPHVQGMASDDVFASRWPHNGWNLWTIVNRGTSDLQTYLTVEHENGHAADWKYYDCYHGTQVSFLEMGNTETKVHFDIEAKGYGCVVQAPMEETVDGDFKELLEAMKAMTAQPLSSYNGTWQFLQQTMVDIPKVGNVTEAPDGMVFVKKAWFSFQSKGVEIEGGDDDRGVDVQYPWEQHPTRSHSHILKVGPFFIDKFPVTTANYSSYLKATGYKPRDSHNWLKNWNGSSEPPQEIEDLPVTFVSLEEARQYCAWAGGRLPHSYEWQYAAQGTDRRLYPWGNDKNQSNYPVLTTGNNYLGPEPVMAHSPEGDSPFGMAAAVGNVWQYTDEFQDAHTRSVILKGGSNYRPTGSAWYFPQALELNTHQKYMLMDESYERAATIGFRCLVDAADETSLVI